MVALSAHPQTDLFPGAVFSAYPYNDVEIAFHPRADAATPMRIGHAEWGLDQATYQLGKLKGFTESMFYLKWEGEIVGYMLFKRAKGASVVERRVLGDTMVEDSRGEGASPVNSSTTHLLSPRMVPSVNRIRVIPTFDAPHGTSIPVGHVFLALLSALIHICGLPTGDSVLPFRSSPQDIDTWVRYEDFGHPPRARTSHPFFENRFAAVALEEVAEWMLRERRFAAATWTVKVGRRVNVGTGHIFTERGAGSG